MDTKVILLFKEPYAYKWSYLLNQKRYYITVDRCPILEQIIRIITDLRDRHDLHDKDVTICSPSLLRTVLYDLTITFPSIHFTPVTDSDVSKIFRKVANRSTVKTINNSRKRSDVLYVCSDASKSATTNMCGWAWFSTNEGVQGYNFGVSEHRSTVTAELEGIFRAITDNLNTDHKKIHVYCDSKQSVEWANTILTGRFDATKTTLKGRMLDLALEAHRVASIKAVAVTWVRGHSNHRLNAAADYLSRAARVEANKQSRLRKTDPDVQAVLTFIDN